MYVRDLKRNFDKLATRQFVDSNIIMFYYFPFLVLCKLYLLSGHLTNR